MVFPSNMDNKGKKARYELAAEDETWLAATTTTPHEVQSMASTGDLDAPESRKQNLGFNEDVSISPAPSDLWGSDTHIRGTLKI